MKRLYVFFVRLMTVIATQIPAHADTVINFASSGQDADVQRALEVDQVILCFQPVVDLRAGLPSLGII
jgi:sensor c-di-GMP phosphodiesterase-like protein